MTNQQPLNTQDEIVALFHRLLERVAALRNKQATIISSRENDFLRLGEQLFGIRKISQQFHHEATNVAAVTSGQALVSAIAGFDQSLQSMHALNAERLDARSQERLAETLEKINALDNLVNGFRRLMKTLKMLGISTRIESARFGKSGGGFMTLADDVDTLTLKVAANITKIKDQIASLTLLVGSAWDKNKEFADTQKICNQEFFNALSRSIQDLRHIEESSRRFAQSLDSRSEALAAHIGQIVTSVQFHDITRQKAEHVDEVINEVLTMVSTFQARAVDKEPIELTSWIGDVVRLQSSQMGEAKESFAQAMGQLLQNMASIQDETAALDTELTTMAQSGDSSEGNVFKRIQTSLDDMSVKLSESAAQGKIFGGTISQVADSATAMAEIVVKIEEIGEDMELIALNALIKAAQAGENGRALGVLASAIRKLSHEARGQTHDVTTILSSITTISHLLYDDANVIMDTSRLDGLIEQLKSALSTLSDVHSQVTQGLLAAGTHGNALLSEISRLVRDAEFHIEVIAKLAASEQALGEIAQEVEKASIPTDRANRPAELKDFLNRYTMESERRVHSQVVDTLAGTAPSETQADQTSSGGLGDNVELF